MWTSPYCCSIDIQYQVVAVSELDLLSVLNLVASWSAGQRYLQDCSQKRLSLRILSDIRGAYPRISPAIVQNCHRELFAEYLNVPSII